MSVALRRFLGAVVVVAASTAVTACGGSSAVETRFDDATAVSEVLGNTIEARLMGPDGETEIGRLTWDLQTRAAQWQTNGQEGDVGATSSTPNPDTANRTLYKLWRGQVSAPQALAGATAYRRCYDYCVSNSSGDMAQITHWCNADCNMYSGSGW